MSDDLSDYDLTILATDENSDFRSERAVAEIRRRRANDLSPEDVEALRFARALASFGERRCVGDVCTQEQADAAIATLDRLIAAARKP